MKIRHLTGFLEEVAAVAGVDAALALARAKGGQRVYITSRATFRKSGSWLTAIVGKEAAAQIVDLFSIGHDVEIPLGVEASRKMRRDIAVELLREGLTINEIARRSGFHRRTVSRYLEKIRKEKPCR